MRARVQGCDSNDPTEPQMNPASVTRQTLLLARNFSWLTLKQLLTRIVGLVTTIYLARTLSVIAYGALGFALACRITPNDNHRASPSPAVNAQY